VNFPSYLSNNAANADLASGADQWGSQYVPNIKAYYLSKNPNYHIWFEPTYNVNIYINLKNSILSNLAVRQAMAYAIDRPAVSKIGESSYEPPSNQTSIVKPTFSSWYDSSEAAQYGNAYAYDPAKAISILEAAGYKKGSNGIFAKDGKSLSFTIINNGGYSDWVAAVNVIETDLKAVGISITPGQPLGHDLAVGPLHRSTTNSPTAGTRAVRRPTTSCARCSTRATPRRSASRPPTTGSATSTPRPTRCSRSTPRRRAPRSSTRSSTSSKRSCSSDVPVIPVTEAVDWYQYDTQSIGGWVTPSDPYAQPDQYAVPDWGVVLLHLYEK
jgi:peptide/nickel transport system substrate-binding protein